MNSHDEGQRWISHSIFHNLGPSTYTEVKSLGHIEWVSIVIDYWQGAKTSINQALPPACHVIAFKPQRYFIFIPDCYYLMCANKNRKARFGKKIFSRHRTKGKCQLEPRKNGQLHGNIEFCIFFFCGGKQMEKLFSSPRGQQKQLHGGEFIRTEKAVKCVAMTILMRRRGFS